MISFEPTQEQQVARESIGQFADQVLRPSARASDEASSLSEDLLQQIWELGLVSTQIPVVYGGMGEERSPLTNALVLEELAHGDLAHALAALAPATFALPILDLGTEEQRKKYLPMFCGERFHPAALAIAEAAPDFDPLALRTTAEPRGSSFVLSGSKCFVPLADRASHFLVVARNRALENGTVGGFRSLDAFIVPADAAGLTVVSPEKNLGLRALPTGTLRLDGVEVKAEDRLGGEAGADAERLLGLARTGQAAAMVGLSRAVMDYAIPYAKERHAFGEAIAQKQAIAFMLSDMRIETDAMRWLMWKAASSLEQGDEPTRASVMARDYAAEQAMKIADNGLQVLGGHGFIREHPVEMWYRNARTVSVLEGVAAV